MTRVKHILIVDDDIELGNLLAKAVSDMSEGYQVNVARDVDEAMVQVRRSQMEHDAFDLVITDIKMSGLSGLELLEALNSIAPETRTIAMTAYNSSEIAHRARELNVEAYLTKPFIISEFRQIVRSTLASQPAPKETARQTGQPGALSADQYAAITRSLSSLRAMTSATIVLLADPDGTLIAVDTVDARASVDELSGVLQTAQAAITDAMSRAFEQSCQVQQSYFGTDAYSVCTYRLDGSYTAAVVFGPAVKEGQVWYYLREAASDLGNTLNAVQTQPERAHREGAGDLLTMPDDFLPQRGRRGRRGTDEVGKRATPSDVAIGPATDAVPPHPPGPGAEADPNASSVMEQDRVTEGTHQPHSVAAADETQQQEPSSPDSGLADMVGEPNVPDRPPVDDIDWDIDADVDWDTIVADTDKGLAGLSFEEAQEQGLIGGIEGE